MDKKFIISDELYEKWLFRFGQKIFVLDKNDFVQDNFHFVLDKNDFVQADGQGISKCM